jgi:hypothetical protein
MRGIGAISVGLGLMLLVQMVAPGSGSVATAGVAEPGFSLSTYELDFGDLDEDQESGSIRIRAYSNDLSQIRMEQVGFDDPSEADFRILNDYCTDPQPSSQCEVDVEMDTSVPGPRSAVLVFEGTGTTGGQRSVLLTGNVIPAESPPVPPKLTKASLKVTVPKQARIGRRFRVRAQITNTGETVLRNLRLASGEDEFGYAFTFRHQNIKIGDLAVGQSIARSLFIRVTRNARPGVRSKFYIYLNSPFRTFAFLTRRTIIRR